MPTFESNRMRGYRFNPLFQSIILFLRKFFFESLGTIIWYRLHLNAFYEIYRIDRDNFVIAKQESVMTRNIGFLLLAIYLILIGLTTLVSGIAIPAIVLGILAIAAGIFILIGR